MSQTPDSPTPQQQPAPARPPTWSELARSWLPWLIMAGASLITWYASYRSGDRAPLTIPAPPPMPVMEPDGRFGWVEDPEAVGEVVKGLTFPTFAATPAGQVRADTLPDRVYLWQVHQRVTGQLPPCKNQNPTGSCVSFGTNTATERVMVCQIARGKPEEFKHIAEEVTYAGSRVQVGKGRIRGDGSVGAWAAQFIKEWGVVSREKHGQYDLTKYDPQRCRSWGSTGCPAELQTLAREHPVQEITKVTSWADAKKSLAQGYGIAICSNVGFDKPGTQQPNSRDASGIIKPYGTWPHCMALDGYHVEAGKEYGHIENSWGPNAHGGPVGWGSPSTAGFWTDAQTIDRMLKQGDSWAFSAVKGFPARELDWFARGDVAPPRVITLRNKVSACALSEPLYSLAP